MILILQLVSAIEGLLADCVDQDQTAQNVQSDLGSTLSDQDIIIFTSPIPHPLLFTPPLNQKKKKKSFEITKFRGFFTNCENFYFTN